MIRTFIALELNDEARSYLRREIQRLAAALPHVRWTDPALLHLTLAFLGEIDEMQLEQATQATLAVAQAAKTFTLRIGAPGMFGPAHSPRVVWIGVAGDLPRLIDLQSRLSARLASIGLPPDERPYAPHLTLARIKDPLTNQELAALRRLITPARTIGGQHRQSVQSDDQATPTISVEHLSVMKSELTRSGSRYTCLHICPFGA